jgi:gluconate 2-dehydrogenase gamma chain
MTAPTDAKARRMPGLRRRELLTTTAYLLLLQGTAPAEVIRGALPWRPGAGAPPARALLGPWLFFTDAEAATVEALVDRLIPPDPETPGGKDAGCAVFIDRQLAGPFGSDSGLYNAAPFQKGTKEQGSQSELTPAQRYRQALAALDKHCRANFAGKGFAALSDDAKDTIIGNLENGSLPLEGADVAGFFKLLLQNTREGFFSDPIYGGNRDMVGWKMIGFPGARYDYRDWVERHNERYPLPPVSMIGRPDWKPAR